MGLLLFVSTWPPKWGVWCLCQHDHQNGVVGVCVSMTIEMGLLVFVSTWPPERGLLEFVSTWPPKWGCWCLCQNDHQKWGCWCLCQNDHQKGGCWCLCQHDHQNGVVGVCVNMTTKLGLLVFVSTWPPKWGCWCWAGLLNWGCWGLRWWLSNQGSCCLCWQDHQVRVIVCVEMTTEHMFYLQWQDGYISCVGQSGHNCVRCTDSDWCRDHVQHQQLTLWLLHGRRQYQQHGKCSLGMFLHSHYKQCMCIRFEQHEKLSLIHLFLLVMCGCSLCEYMIACVCGCMCTTHTHV